jgi:hypothetical protein
MRKKIFKANKQDQQDLDAELQRILDSVGAEHYAKATARQFAPGGRFRRKQRPRYAKR